MTDILIITPNNDEYFFHDIMLHNNKEIKKNHGAKFQQMCGKTLKEMASKRLKMDNFNRKKLRKIIN